MKFLIRYWFGKCLIWIGIFLLVALLSDVLMSILIRKAFWWIENWPYALNVWLFGLVCLILLIVVIGLIRKLRGGSHSDQDSSFNGFIQSEAAIQSSNKDLLHRTPFVRMLMDLLAHVPTDAGACCVGLYGKWGEGKTSVINLIKESCRDNKDSNLVFVDFSPWKYSDQEEIPFRFFLQLSDSMVRQSGMLQYESAMFASLGQLLRMKYAERKIGTLGSAIDFIRWWWFSKFCDEDSLRDELKRCLLGSRNRMIVIIDDLDRLPDEDVRRFITFIKAHADLAGLVFLIAADESRLAEAVGGMVSPGDGKSKDGGRRYLEKIIPISRELPAINGEDLFRMLNVEVDHIIRASCPDGIDRSDLDLQIFTPYLHDIRCLKRMCNAIALDLSLAKRLSESNGCFGFDIGDFVAVSVLREFERDFYHILPTVRGKLDTCSSVWYDAQSVDDDWLDNNLYRYASAEGKGVCEWFVKNRFGLTHKVEGGKAKYSFPPYDSPDAILNRRFSSRHYFPGYYFMDTGFLPIRQDDREEFLESIQKNEYPATTIDRLNKNGSLPYFLYSLQDHRMFDDAEISQAYTRTLVRMSEESLSNNIEITGPIRTGDIFSRNIYERIFLALYGYVLAVQKSLVNRARGNHIGTSLLPILEEHQAVYLMGEFIAAEHNKHGEKELAYLGCVFSHDEYAKLESDFVELIAERQKDDYATKHVACFDLLRCWMLLIRKYDRSDWRQAFVDANDHCLEDYCSLSRILVFFSRDNRADQDDQFAFAVEADRIYGFWSEEQVDRIEKTLDNCVEKDERDEKFLKCLKFVRRQKSMGKDFDVETQMKYLHGSDV